MLKQKQRVPVHEIHILYFVSSMHWLRDVEMLHNELCNCSWNRTGHKLLTASTDFVVSIWDVFTGECDRTFRFPSPVLKVQFHPRNRSGDIFDVHQVKFCY